MGFGELRKPLEHQYPLPYPTYRTPPLRRAAFLAGVALLRGRQDFFCSPESTLPGPCCGLLAISQILAVFWVMFWFWFVYPVQALASGSSCVVVEP